MVCIRCKMVVKDELSKLGLHFTTVELGEADIVEELSAQQHDQLEAALLRYGLEIMDDKNGDNRTDTEDKNGDNRTDTLYR